MEDTTGADYAEMVPGSNGSDTENAVIRTAVGKCKDSVSEILPFDKGFTGKPIDDNVEETECSIETEAKRTKHSIPRRNCFNTSAASDLRKPSVIKTTSDIADASAANMQKLFLPVRSYASFCASESDHAALGFQTQTKAKTDAISIATGAVSSVLSSNDSGGKPSRSDCKENVGCEEKGVKIQMLIKRMTDLTSAMSGGKGPLLMSILERVNDTPIHSSHQPLSVVEHTWCLVERAAREDRDEVWSLIERNFARLRESLVTDEDPHNQIFKAVIDRASQSALQEYEAERDDIIRILYELYKASLKEFCLEKAINLF